ncbi:hypothetical protein E3E12_02290 [Formicincola oecophyllae]|uniref:Uncharacterized protein n=1 Tax=Formicincola oecophyllae TaxID=2558361 RepID=A0A4Y6U8C1_9PROT|nr:hypothetical protein [Formicincola oecophyllae]QDH13220.1 hypothetical protein E3E12_02290 [Formicincola oecophyllae]
MPKALSPHEVESGRTDIANELARASTTGARRFMIPVRAVAYFFPKLTPQQLAAAEWPGAFLPHGQGQTDMYPPLDRTALDSWLEIHGSGFRAENQEEGDYPDMQIVFVR